jgi:hypothetical protein
LGFLDPLTAIIVTFCFIGVLIYKRVNLGITLNAGALLLALLALDLPMIWTVLVDTTVNPLTISLVAASFAIMWLSLLYKETKVIDTLSESLSKLVNNSKLIISVLPAVLGLLPVGGGALMSAPLVEAETEKLGMTQDKKTYANLWFRHTVFPVYPVNQVLILAASLTGLTVTALVTRQIPVVITMVAVGYFIGLRKTPKKPEKEKNTTDRRAESKRFLVTFLPIIATIVAVIAFGIDVSIGAFIGIIVLLLIAKPNLKTLIRPLRNWGIWGITLAAYGAFLLRDVSMKAGISQIFGSVVSNGSIDLVPLLIIIPAFFSAVTGAVSGGLALSTSVLGIATYTPKTASLLYMTSYLGYVGAPTHLCLILTAEYFKCPLGKLYKYLIPSLIVSFVAAILMYYLV